MNVLVVLGHPRTDSYCGALAEAFRRGAESAAGVTTRYLALVELDFDPYVRVDSPENQTLEPDLARARDWLRWADHLVFVYPTWWGTMPALLKGFLDRLVMPGEAFHFYGPGATEWEGFWKDKSAQLITTMDTPPAIYRLVYRSPGIHAMKDATLGFCGVGPTRTLICGPLRISRADQRRRWLERAYRTGAALTQGVRSPMERRARGLSTWLRALRLQFYPMTWAAYTVGALAATERALDWRAYGWGYALLFFLEAATVFCNDYFDYGSDRRNPNYGPFTGGSRMLVEGRVTFGGLRRAIGVAGMASAVVAVVATAIAPSPLAVIVWLGIAFVLTLGYTVPPLCLSYRGFGEMDVAVTHSALVLLIGWLLQGGSSLAPEPWIISLPLALSILPAIVLAGIPDRQADTEVGKHTLVERHGVPTALTVAASAVAASAAIGIVFDLTHAVDGLFDGIGYPVVVHAATCLWLLHRLNRRFARSDAPPRRIDLPLVVILHYMVWFVGVPLYWLI